MSDDRMPPDPFDEPSALGVVGDIIAEAGLLLDALAEARERGALLEAVWALDRDDLRAITLDLVLRDALRRRHFGESER
jgi:hypothetical protein